MHETFVVSAASVILPSLANVGKLGVENVVVFTMFPSQKARLAD